MTMLKVEIAGETVSYRNAPDLTDKVQKLLQTLTGKRTAIETIPENLFFVISVVVK